MPEGDQTPQEPQTTEPQADPAPEPVAPEPSSEPAPESGGPDLTDAISQMNAAREAFERGGEPQDDGFGRFLGDIGEPYGEPEPAYDDPAQAQAQGEPDPMEEARTIVREEFQQMLGQYHQEQTMERRHEGVLQLADQIPQLREPAVQDAVDAAMRTIDPNYGIDGYVPDPKVLRLAYRAAQAELAESSQTPEGGQEAPAEAGGSEGQHVETGAGPGAQPQQADPVEEAYTKALAGVGNVDPYGFPVQQP